MPLMTQHLTDAQREQWLMDIAEQLKDGLLDEDEAADWASQVRAMPKAED